MKTKLVVAAWIILFNCSCNNGDLLTSKETNNYSVIKPSAKKTKKKLTFFDSILTKSYLSFNQIKKATVLNSDYATPDMTFMGDTIYYDNPKYIIAIISAYGPNCGNKFMLIFNRDELSNTYYQLVGNECDDDDFIDYSFTAYKRLDGRNFLTEETSYKRKSGYKTKVTITDRYYLINNDGKIKPLKSIKRKPFYMSEDD